MAQIAAGAGANGGIYEHQQPKEQHRSKFDLSRITNLTADSGMIIPFDFFETLPNDSFNLSAEVALETLPTITNVLTPYHVRTHWYYIRNSDLWKGWNTFITKGRTGSIELEIPKTRTQPLNIPVRYRTEAGTKEVSTVIGNPTHSLASYLGALPTWNPEKTWKQTQLRGADDYTGTSTGYTNPDKISALPFMAYQAICKYNYVNQNLLQENKALFPEEGDSDWRIPYDWEADADDGAIYTVSGESITSGIDIEKNGQYEKIADINGVYSNDDNVVLLTALRYAPFEDDYFTTALPWQQRGEEQTLETELDLSNLNAQFVNGNISANVMFTDGTQASFTDVEDLLKIQSADARNSSNNGVIQINGLVTTATALNGYSREYYQNAGIKLNPEGSIRLNTSEPLDAGTTITANQLREMIAMSVWQERNARVNGSYNSMIWIHFEHNPKTEDHYPIFIGGTSSYINFGEVTQTSASTNDSPQGNITSKGTMYETQDIGHFECPDYGYIMGILIISPTTTYNTTIPHELISENVMEDYFFPEFEQLGMQPILNKELKATGNSTKDNDLWGYQERYSYLKTRQNVNRGLFRLKSETDTLFSAATQSREFEGTDAPKLSYQFVTQTPENTRRDWLAYENEPMFKVQIASKVTATRNMSYASKPNNFGF